MSIGAREADSMKTIPVSELTFTGQQVHERSAPHHDPVPDYGQQAQGDPVGESILVSVPEPDPANYLGMYQLTFYCLQGVMANGNYVHPRAVASDGIHRLGDRLYIAGFGDMMVADRFAVDLMRRRLDVWVESCDDAIQLGTFKTKVWRG